MHHHDDHDFMTIRMVAERLRVSDRTVRNWIRDGALRAVRVGPRGWRIEAIELERFLRAGRS